MPNIKKIEIKNFKGISNATEYFGDMPKYVSGKNGEGKTSFLEAIRYALTGKTPTREEILRKGSSYGYVCITFDDADETSIAREFYAEKPTKVTVNGKPTTAKSAQKLIDSLLDTDSSFLDMNTSSEVFRELFKGELGKFLLGFVNETFTIEKLFELISFSDSQKSFLSSKLPATFGLAECENLYKEFFETRAALKVSVQKLSAQIPETIIKPSRTMEDVEKDLAGILAAEQMKKAQDTAIKNYTDSLNSYNARLAEISRLENEYNSIAVDNFDPLEGERLLKEKQSVLVKKTTAEGTIKTLKSNIAVFRTTLATLETNVCPVSSKLICTTDKTAAKSEFTQLIAENEKAIEAMSDEIASYEITLKTLVEKEACFKKNEQLVAKRENLLASITRAKSVVGKPPVKPEPPKPVDLSQKENLLAEKRQIDKYEEILKTQDALNKATAELELYNSLVKLFAAKGAVNEAIIGFYCDIFNEEIELVAAACGYQILFLPENGLTLSVKPGNNKSFVTFDELSAGEQLIAAVLVNHLCNTLSGCCIMLVDDFNELDEFNSDKLKNLLDELSVNYSMLVVAGTNLS